jgi:hypothetical protein
MMDEFTKFENLTEQEWSAIVMLVTELSDDEVYEALAKGKVTFSQDGLGKCHAAVMKYGPAIARNRPQRLN